jgi:hypothetical protein
MHIGGISVLSQMAGSQAWGLDISCGGRHLLYWQGLFNMARGNDGTEPLERNPSAVAKIDNCCDQAFAGFGGGP